MSTTDLSQLPHGGTVVIDSEGRWDVAAVQRRVQALRRHWAPLAGEAVAVQLRSPREFVFALLALQGWVRRILLLPADADDTTAQDFAQRAELQWMVGDAPTQDTGPSTLLRVDCAAPDTDAEPRPASATTLDTEWLLTTSGTTGTPKLVSHRLAGLCATVQRDARLGQACVWGLLYDPARFAGLQVVLQALCGGSALALPAWPSTLPQRLRFFADAGVNALSATPTLWRKLLMTQAADTLDLRIVTLGGEMADRKILDALHERYPRARVRHVYASTEAGVGFSVADGEEGFPQAWLTQPPAGIELAVRGIDAAADHDAQEGELWLRSARVARGYCGGDAWREDEGWVPSGDRVQVCDGRVRFLGRLNGAINVGGDKVYPEAVEQALLRHPLVFAAHVQARRSAFTGALVEALVVPSLGSVADAAARSALLAHCRQCLPRHAVPALLRFVDELETGSSGKQLRA